MSFLVITLLIKVPPTNDLLTLNLKGEEVDLYYSPSQLYVDYKGSRTYINADKHHQFIDIALGDIDSDGVDEILSLVGNKGSPHGNELVIYNLTTDPEGLQLKQSYRNDISLIKPWKIETCEIDKDDELEIFIAVHKSTHYYKDVENRPFFFNFRDGKLIKKWTGSKVRAPFTDVFFIDIDHNGRDEFIVIEKAEEEGFVIAVYYWFGFGFILQAESTIYEVITSVSMVKTEEETLLELEVMEAGKFKRVLLETSTLRTKNEIYLLKERGI